MELRNEILGQLMSSSLGIRELLKKDSRFKSYTIKDDGFFGVAIPNANEIEIYEKFENVELKSVKILNDGVIENFLFLTSDHYQDKIKFSYICEDFVSLGNNDANRKKILENPYTWWNEWGLLLGDVKSNKSPYSTLAELWTMLYEIESGNSAIKWGGSEYKTHDLESEKYNIEVKSSTSLYNEEVTISSHFQLDHENDLFMYYFIVQENIEGVSINDIIDKLINLNVDIDMIEGNLKRLGFNKGSNVRNIKYKILEVRKYIIDESFPSITLQSFKNMQLPKGVKKVSYVVDLVNINYERLELMK